MAHDIADDGSNVVFLLSSPRAGSTLLSAILGRHSKVLCPAEPWFLLSLHGLYYETLTGIAPYDQKLAGLGLREFVDEEGFLGAARAFASSLYGSRLAAAGRSVFVDKTPRYYHILPFLEALFPRARMLWLKRNPLDVAASYKTTWNIPAAELSGRDLSPNSFDLTIGLRNLGAWFDGRAGRLEVSYEDLVANPERMIGTVIGSLGLESEPGLGEYGANADAMSALRRSSLGDKKVLDHKRPHDRSVGQWRDVLSAGELSELLSGVGTETFLRMGYEEALAEASRKAGFDPGEEHRAPRHLEKLRLYQRWFAAAMPTEQTVADRGASAEGSDAPMDSGTARLAMLEARLAASEADREARLAVIENQASELGRMQGLVAERDDLLARLTVAEADREARLAVIQRQGAEIGRIPELVAERDDLLARLAVAEADREARLAVIQKQGAEIGRIPALVAERDDLLARLAIAETNREARLRIIEKQQAELDALTSTLEEIRRRTESAVPRTFLGMMPPSEVRRLTEFISAVLLLAHCRRGQT